MGAKDIYFFFAFYMCFNPKIINKITKSKSITQNRETVVKGPNRGGIKRPDGIVAIDYTKAKKRGAKLFKAVKKVCPYTAALYFDDGKSFVDAPDGPQTWEGRTTYEYNKLWTRDQIIGSPRKCHFCLHRLTIGELPACVTTCIGKAMMFGDKNDPTSYVAQVLKDDASSVLRIKERYKTEPRVYYLSETPKECADQH